MKRYVLEIEVNDKGQLSIAGKNIGFNSYELLGILKWKIDDIIQQIEGNIRPDVINRVVIK